MVFRAAERTEARRSCAEDTDCNGGGGFGEEGLQGKRCVEGLCVEAMENIGGIGAGEREDADRCVVKCISQTTYMLLASYKDDFDW